MNRLGIDASTYELCEDEEIEPGLKAERDAMLENIQCLRRLLNEFIPKILEAYCKMNEFFERNPMSPIHLDKLQNCLISSRFKLIELSQLLKNDHILKNTVVDPDLPSKEEQEA